MSIELFTPRRDDLAAVVSSLATWQYDGAPVQLHPGDIGWFHRYGAAACAAALRAWRREDETLALGLLDGDSLVRLAVAPHASEDGELARRMLSDLTESTRILPEGDVAVEARGARLLRQLLLERGWALDEAWTPLARDLSAPVASPDQRIVVTTPESAEVRVAIQRSAFENSTFSVDAWREMSRGAAYAQARCLVAYDDRDRAVAAATVWSAGVGRPGLLEPLGVHRDARGRGYGRAICLGAAAALRELGASSATVCTPSANVAAIATYESAGFARRDDARDLRRTP